MNRAARLQSAKHWLPTYEGRDPVKGYRNWYGVSTACAIIELRQLGIKIDEQRLIQAKRTEESKAKQRSRKRQQRAEKYIAADELLESDEIFAYVAGYTALPGRKLSLRTTCEKGNRFGQIRRAVLRRSLSPT